MYWKYLLLLSVTPASHDSKGRGSDRSTAFPFTIVYFYLTKYAFPYSVIPGGVLSHNELARAIDRDPVVARHYSGFVAREARLVRTQDEKLVHVSYRMENKVFWSTKKIRLARSSLDGNGLLRDGAQAGIHS